MPWLRAASCRLRHINESYARLNLEAEVGPYVMITIAYTGTGIPPENLDRIFEPFFTTKEPEHGTGLGLSTALSLVKKQEGFLNIYSEPGKGIQVQVFLPADISPEMSSGVAPHLPRGNGETILVVDDEVAIRAITQKMLETYNYRVIVAADGIDAVSIYSEHRSEIRLVLMDMMMPTMDGVMAIQALRKLNPMLPIVAMSGLRMSDKISDTLKEGSEFILPKPFTTEELLIRLQEILHA